MRVLTFAIAASGVLAACEDPPPRRSFEQPEATIRAPATEIDDVDRSLEGHTIRVVGRVERVLDDRAFVVAEDGVFDGSSIVVFARSYVTAAGVPIRAARRVIVIGIVRTSIPAVEMALGRELPPRLEELIAGRPVIVARDVHVAD